MPRLLGAEDDPSGPAAATGPLRELARRLRGLRFGRSDAVMASLVPAIIEQKVTGREAQRRLSAAGPALRRAGARAGGLHCRQLRPPGCPALLRPAPAGPGATPRGDASSAPPGAARRLEASVTLPHAEALARLRAVPGVGAWTAAETARAAFGDPDAVSLGDFHLPNLVAWALAGEPRGDDARMLELLEPFRGQRARARASPRALGHAPPRYGPRRPLRWIVGI